MSRIEAIRKILAERPGDPFARYGLAMELKNAGRADEAEATFAELGRGHPGYVPRYLMHGDLLAALGRRDQAKAVYEQGIAAAAQAGNGHAASELQRALDGLLAHAD